MSDLKSYEYVLAIAECGAISEAAEKLGIAQPTLSRYIIKLENELGVTLFDRRELPLRPTGAGRAYVEAAKKLIYLEGQLKKQLDEEKGIKNSIVRVGISPSRSPYMMPAIVETFRKKNQSARLIIEEKTTAELAQRLANGDIDLAISLLDNDTEQFEREELFSEDILLALRRGTQEVSDAKQIMLHTPLISVGRGQAMWRSLHNLADAIGAPEPQIECQSIESALALTARGLGAMLVPSYIVKFASERERTMLDFLPLPSHSLTRRVCLFWKRESHLTKAEQTFIDSVKQTLFSIDG